jgi:GT2 family glycosyltransferase
MMRDVLFLVVSYDSPGHALKLLQSLASQSEVDRVRVVVVENCSAADTSGLAQFCSTYAWALLLQPAENLGYFGGARHAMAAIDRTAIEWTVVSNADVTLDDLHFVRNLRTTPWPKTAGVIAPAIISMRTGCDQNPHLSKRPTRLRMHFYKWVFSTFVTGSLYFLMSTFKAGLLRFFTSFRWKDLRPRLSGRIYAPQGSFIILRREYFEKGGTLDHTPFLFGEEITIAEAARAAGLEVYYEPSLRLSHHEHESTGVLRSRTIAAYFGEAARYCADRYF